MRALEGIKVIEVATFIAGPYCAMTLADHGATVIKVERPGGGDENRAEPPFINGESAPFMLWNRGKRSIVLDLKSEHGRQAFLKLAGDADVVIENLRPGAMDRLGLGFAKLSAVNPRLIYAAVSGYGLNGPMKEKGGFDLILQGFSGLMAANGPKEGPPFRLPVPICDIAAGMLITNGILLALQARERTGHGQLVETSLLDAALSLQPYELANYFATGEEPQRIGQRHRGVAPYQVFATGDGHITIGVATQSLWTRFCEVLVYPELASDLRFATNADRVSNADALVEAIEGRLRTRSNADWLKDLEFAGIPCGPINGIKEAIEHPQSRARRMVVEIVHPVAGRQRTLGIPVKLSSTPGEITLPAPTLGEHSASMAAGSEDFGLSE